MMTVIHIISGVGGSARQVEVAALANYRDWLKAEFPADPVILAVDLNPLPLKPAWGTELGRD